MDFPNEIRNLVSESHDFLSYVLPKEGVEVFFSEIEKGSFVPMHDHGPVMVLNFVADGKIEMDFGNRKQTFKLGDWCEINPNEKHSLRAIEPTRLIEFWIKK